MTAAKAGSPNGGQPVETVKVVVRVRPLNTAEKQENYKNIVHVDSINGKKGIELGKSAIFNTEKRKKGP